MPAKPTSKKLLTLSKAAVACPDAATSIRARQARMARDKLARLGTTERDVADAMAWARR